MISFFSFYKPLFMVQLLISEFLFTCRLKKRSFFSLRYSAMCVVCLAVSALIAVQPENAVELSGIFILLFALTFVLNFFCYDVKPFGLLFCLVSAYVVQHFAYCMSNCMLIISGLNANVYGVYTEEVASDGFKVNEVFGYIFSFAIYWVSYHAFYLFFGRRIKKNEEPKPKNAAFFVMGAVAVIISIFVNAVVVYGTVNGMLITVINIYNAACCVFILCVLFFMSEKVKMKDELDTVYELLNKSREQYELSKMNIEMINIKCHDLKHQIRSIGKDNRINEVALKEMSDAISIYDSEVETGNPALDMILSEKSLYCYKNNIKITCIADGALLNFMNEAEVYSMFGNAIDNAVSAVLKTNGEDKRCIGLSVCRVKDFVAVNVHNYFNSDLKYSSDGMPVTTKADRENHGFGLKSIKYIAEKYSGSVSVKTEDEIFNLNIIFPLKTEPR